MRIILSLFLSSCLLCFIQCTPDKTATKQVATGDSAIDKLGRLIEEDPENHTLLYDRAQLNYKASHFDEAIEDLSAAIKTDSLVPQYYHLLSDVYMDYYRSKDALLIMTEAGELFPKRIPTLLKLSETQLILKQNEESLLTVARILTLEPNNTEGHFMTGMNFRAMGETDRAIAAFQRATAQDPELLEAWLIIGELFESKKDPRALEYYDTAINLAPDNPSTWHSKAFYLQNNGKDDEAIAIYKKIAGQVDKSYLDAYLNAGILYLTKDSIDQALDQFDIMAQIKPQDYRPYFYRGLCYEAMGNIGAARADFQNCLNLNPDFSRAKQAMDNLSNS